MACFPKYKDGSTVNRRKRNQKWSYIYACLLPHWHWSPTRWQFEHIFSLLYLSRKDRRFLCSTQPWPPLLWQKDWAIHEGKERFQRFLSMVTDFVLVSRSGPVRDTVQAHIMVKQRMHTLTACPLPTWLWGSQFLASASSAILGTKPSAHGHSVGTQDGNYSRSHLECGRRERHCAYSRSTQIRKISTYLLGQEHPLFLVPTKAMCGMPDPMWDAGKCLGHGTTFCREEWAHCSYSFTLSCLSAVPQARTQHGALPGASFLTWYFWPSKKWAHPFPVTINHPVCEIWLH